jgi:urease accessory protein
LVPAAFVVTMTAGAALGRSGMEIAGVEQGIAASLLVLGLLIAGATRLPVAAGMALAAVFACFHGYAHGAEAPATGDAWQYGAGFVGTTALLHLAGLRLGGLLQEDRRAIRLVGSAVAGAGLVAMVLA